MKVTSVASATIESVVEFHRLGGSTVADATNDEPRCYRALKRTAKFKPSLRDEEGGCFARKLWAMKRTAVVGIRRTIQS
jgi:hypothetical protein